MNGNGTVQVALAFVVVAYYTAPIVHGALFWAAFVPARRWRAPRADPGRNSRIGSRD
jgi:type IV secretory pathway TrbD component